MTIDTTFILVIYLITFFFGFKYTNTMVRYGMVWYGRSYLSQLAPVHILILITIRICSDISQSLC